MVACAFSNQDFSLASALEGLGMDVGKLKIL
jgi:hypothetical protein